MRHDKSTHHLTHVTCACYAAEHTLRFSCDPENKEIYTEVLLTKHDNWLKRVWIAIKYVFGYDHRYGHYDCFLMHELDADGLIEMLQAYKKLIKEANDGNQDNRSGE